MLNLFLIPAQSGFSRQPEKIIKVDFMSAYTPNSEEVIVKHYYTDPISEEIVCLGEFYSQDNNTACAIKLAESKNWKWLGMVLNS